MSQHLQTPPTDFDHHAAVDSGLAPLEEVTHRTNARSRRRQIKQHELVDITSQLAIMARSGVDLSTALRSIAKQSKRPIVANVLRDVHEQVTSGKSFSAALKSHERTFGATYVAMVSAAEASGKMASVLMQLSKLLRGELRLMRSIRSMISYPIVLASVSSLVIAALLLFVLPRFSELFEQYNLALPWLTFLLLAFSEALTGNWFIVLPAFAAVCIAAAVFRISPQGKWMWDTMIIHAPLLRNVSRTLIVGRTCRMLGLMLESGVPLLDALRLVRSTTSNSLFRDLFQKVHDDVLKGLGITQALRGETIMPSSAMEMITTAERTGNLGEVSSLIGEAFEEDAEASLKQTITVAEPLITVVMGFAIAIVVLAVMLPVFDLAMMAGS